MPWYYGLRHLVGQLIAVLCQVYSVVEASAIFYSTILQGMPIVLMLLALLLLLAQFHWVLCTSSVLFHNAELMACNVWAICIPAVPTIQFLYIGFCSSLNTRVISWQYMISIFMFIAAWTFQCLWMSLSFHIFPHSSDLLIQLINQPMNYRTNEPIHYFSPALYHKKYWIIIQPI